MNISDVLERQSNLLGAASCIHFADGDWTFNELNQSVWRIANLLHRKGVQKGDVVAHTFQSELVLLVTMMATARIGATVFSVSLKTPLLRKNDMLNKVCATYLATDLPTLQLAGLETIHISLDAVDPIGNNVEKCPKDNSPAAPWIIVAGSGSTGSPKFMGITHLQQLARMEAGLEWLPYSAEDILYSLVDLDYYGSKQRYLEAFTKGAGIALVDRRQTTISEAIINHKISVVYATVFHIERLLQSIPVNCRDYLDSLKALMLGGSTVSSNLRFSIRDRLCSRLYVLYGANECHTTCCTRLSEVYDLPGNVGRPHKGFELQIVDDSDCPLPDSQVGRIRIRSKAMIDGYFDNNTAAAQAFINGWFYPGDLGKFSPDGQLIHMGRCDDMMIMNGINIYPAEIEQTMSSHPEVIDAVALPVKHKVHQDIPVCAVSLLAESSLTEQDLIFFSRGRLGAHSPKRIIVLEKIPRNELGKPIRNELVKLVTEKLNQPPIRVSTALNMTGIARNQASKQLTRRINFSFSLPKDANPAILDGWLNYVLESKPGDRIVEQYSGLEQEQVIARQWLSHCLQLSRFILLSASVPVFDAPEVVASRLANQTTRKWYVTTVFARIDDVPAEVYRAALDTAFMLGEWILTREPTTANLHFFFETIKTRVIDRYLSVSSRGKSTLQVLRVAYDRGIPFRHIGGGFYQLGWGANSIHIDRSTTELDSAMGNKLSQSKVLTVKLLRSAGLPTAKHQLVANLDEGIELAERLGWPVVVKPADRDRGLGVTVDVSNAAKLSTAYALASEVSHSKQIIIEQQVEGVCHRLFISGGKLLYAVKRLPMAVKGNGKQTVSELVASEMEVQQRIASWKRSKVVPLDSLALAAIEAAGFSMSSVPKKDVLVPLRRIESTEWGGIDEEVTDRVHPENLRIALEATKLFRLEVAGVDIISPDIAKPWYENNAIINEVNFAPLLGGGEISKRHIPFFLDQYIAGNGRIPVEVYVGGESAWQAASERWRDILGLGAHSYISSGSQTLGPAGTEIHMPLTGLFQRVRALVLNSKVESIVLVVQTDELLGAGLPLEFVDHITHIDDRLESYRLPQTPLPADRVQLLVRLLDNWES